jgi:hypothetical protein
MWHFNGSGKAIPSDRDLMLAVTDHNSLVALEFPCRYVDGCWIDSKTRRLVEVHPTHWREWIDRLPFYFSLGCEMEQRGSPGAGRQTGKENFARQTAVCSLLLGP